MSSLIGEDFDPVVEESLAIIEEVGRDKYVLTEKERRAEFLLKFHPTMIKLIFDYEKVENTKTSTLSQDDISNAYGHARREHGRELYTDVTANTVVLKYKKAAIYSLYKQLSEILNIVINNIIDAQSKKIAELMFIKGVRHSDAYNYLRKGYSSELGVIPLGTFTYKRINAIKEVASSLEVLGVLDLIQKNEGVGRCKKQQYRIDLEEWSAYEE
jgi:hypothetical protein